MEFVSLRAKLIPNKAGIIHRNFQGTPHLVVPVTAFKEGVFNDLFSPASEIELATPSWGGRPIPIHHPEDSNGEPLSANSVDVLDSPAVIGRFMNPVFEDNSLKGDFFIDMNQANRSEQGRSVVSTLKAGSSLDVSVGFYSRIYKEPGNFNGSDYLFVTRDHKPDHVAVLLDEKGACSRTDGCGVGMSNREVIMDKEEVTSTESNPCAVTNRDGITVWSYSNTEKDTPEVQTITQPDMTLSVVEKILEAIKQAFTPKPEAIQAVDHAEEQNTSEVKNTEEENAVSQDVQNECACKKASNNNQEVRKNMDKGISTLVDQLIESVPSLENNRAELEAFDEETLKSLANKLVQKDNSTEVSATEKPAVEDKAEVQDTQASCNSDKEPSELERFAATNNYTVQEMGTVLADHTRRMRARRVSLVSTIVTNSGFSAEELGNKDVWTMDRLETLATSLDKNTVEADYSGRGGPSNHTQVDRGEENPIPELTFTREERGFIN